MTRPVLLTVTVCNWPAGYPFCEIVLMVALPPRLAYCDNPPEPDVHREIAERLP